MGGNRRKPSRPEAQPPTTVADLRLGLELFARYRQLGAFDAVLAGVALVHGAEALVSADRSFGAVNGLPWIDPASDTVGDLAAGREL